MRTSTGSVAATGAQLCQRYEPGRHRDWRRSRRPAENQVGGGNGKKPATVVAVMLGGYVGNEVAHGRNPVPGTQK
jgi:hypothetical protein